MKKIFKSILVGIIFSAVFTCISYAKPVRTYIMPDKYVTADSVESFCKLYNYYIVKVGDTTVPLITDLKKVETVIPNSNVYTAHWGDYSSVVFQEDASNNRILTIVVATPSVLFSNDFVKTYGTEPGYQFATEVSLLEGFFEPANGISDADAAISKEKNLNCFTNQASDSFSVGKLHYDYNFGKDTTSFTLSAYTDDGK